MKQFTRRVRLTRRALFDFRILIAVMGVALSIFLHEAFHVALHWGSIVSIHIFPSPMAIMAVDSYRGLTTDIHAEEAIAYGITLSVMVITAVVIGYVSDKKDSRSFTEIVFPKNKTMQAMSKRELFELAARVNLL